MRFRFFLIIISFFINEYSLSQNRVSLPKPFATPLADELKLFHSLSEGQLEDLLRGDVISVSKVTTPEDKRQELSAFIAGVHPRNCTRAMRKLSRYEDYHSYVDFIKKSSYVEATQQIDFTLDHVLLPFPMGLVFKLPRITGPGHYPFTFTNGFLKDLRGTIVVSEVGKFCLLGLKADWKGPETKIPNLAFEAFLQTVGKLGLEHLIRVSLF